MADFYKKNLKFDEEQRVCLVGLIVQFFEQRGIPMSLAASYKLEQEIIERFPSEKLQVLNYV